MLCRGALHYFLDPLKWRLPRGALVLEVGSGQKPMWRGDVQVDRHLEDDTHRPGRLFVARGLICGDVADLPFEDDAFDFVYCAHLLEHTLDPVQAVHELGRVGRAGVFSAPSYAWERKADCPVHRWIVRVREGALEFSPKPADVSTIECNSADDEVVYYWRGRPRARRLDGDRPVGGAGPADPPASLVRQLGRRAMVRAGLLLHTMLSANARVDKYTLLRCLRCHAQLQRTGQSLECTCCTASYEIRDGTPIMLEQDAPKT